ncbi:MAG: O-antigen ligase family protein [Clostridiales bacterium]|nr:O-antigen ligase family protein [Clostridiales bacterium]
MRRPIHHQLSAPVTPAATKTNKIPWEVITLLGAIGCILMTTYRYLDLAHGGAVLTYLLYPASIFSVALLLYTRDYIKYWEIRLLGVFFVWVLAVIAMNYWRASDAISSGWMHSLISISILCFSLPYALRDINPKAALRILSAVTILLTAVTGIVALYLVLTGNSIDFRPAIEGVLGMDDEGRLEFFNHPNIAASACGLSILLSIGWFAETKRTLVKVLLVPAALVCYLALALTDSRTGIIATALVAGYAVFLLCGAKPWPKSGKLMKVLFYGLIALCVAAVFYVGTTGVKRAYNAYAELRASAAAPVAAATAAPDAQATETPGTAAAESAPAAPTPTESEAAFEQAASRSLSDASTFNGRTLIWKGAIQGLRDNPKILLTGTTPLLSGEIMTSYLSVLEPMRNFHNSFLAVLVGLGVPGFVLFTLFMAALWVLCVRLVVKHWGDTSNLSLKMLTAVVLFTTLYGLMEQLIVTDGMPNLVWVWLMLAAGYLMKAAHLEKERLSDN